jgi:hypothetical protein
MKSIGSRSEVMHGVAKHTKGNLSKKDLKYNKHGRIVSKRMSQKAKRDNRLVKAGFIPKKGLFKLFKKSDGKKSRKSRKSRKMRGGNAFPSIFSSTPADFNES